MKPRTHPTFVLVVTFIAGLSVAACSSTPASSTAASAEASEVSGGSQAASTAPVASAGGVSVDLVFSGTLAFTAKGSAGQCLLGHNSADGSIVFAFSATEADYPGLGDGIYLNEDVASHALREKWLSSEVASVGDLPEESFTFSADHKSVTLDADLPGGIDKPEHLSGTITCP